MAHSGSRGRLEIGEHLDGSLQAAAERDALGRQPAAQVVAAMARLVLKDKRTEPDDFVVNLNLAGRRQVIFELADDLELKDALSIIMDMPTPPADGRTLPPFSEEDSLVATENAAFTIAVVAEIDRGAVVGNYAGYSIEATLIARLRKFWRLQV